jgi:hypothetical protein
MRLWRVLIGCWSLAYGAKTFNDYLNTEKSIVFSQPEVLTTFAAYMELSVAEAQGKLKETGCQTIFQTTKLPITVTGPNWLVTFPLNPVEENREAVVEYTTGDRCEQGHYSPPENSM